MNGRNRSNSDQRRRKHSQTHFTIPLRSDEPYRHTGEPSRYGLYMPKYPLWLAIHFSLTENIVAPHQSCFRTVQDYEIQLLLEVTLSTIAHSSTVVGPKHQRTTDLFFLLACMCHSAFFPANCKLATQYRCNEKPTRINLTAANEHKIKCLTCSQNVE